MSNGLPYLSLRCVLEYLDVNKRIHITARSPALQKFEKQIPLHIDHLGLKDNSIRINSVTHEMHHSSEYNCTNTTGKKSKTLYPLLIDRDGVKVVMSFFLDRKVDIYVKNLDIDMEKKRGPKVLSSNIQLKIRKLNTGYDSYSNAFVDFIHPSSFPLLELTTSISNVEELDLEALKSVKKLILSSRDYIGVIQGYLSTPRSIGASLEIGSFENNEVMMLMSHLKAERNGINVRIEKSIERLSHHTPCSIPINATSAALIYGVYHSVSGTFLDVKTEIVPADSVVPVVPSLEH